MGKFFKKYYLFLALAALAFIIHFSFLTYPSEVVFDEVHFGKFVSGYFTGEYFFDIHPPLGKLMIAGFGKMTGLDTASFIPSAGSADTATSIGFDHIGEPLPPQILFTLRFLPALFGALFVLAFSWLAWLASNSKTASLIAGFLALADHAFLVQSKFILVDIFLLFFTVLAFCFFFLWQRQKSWSCKWFLYLILAAVSFGFSISIKWTAVATLGIFAVVLFAKIFSSRLANYLSKTNASRQKKLIEGLVGLVFILIIASLLYAGFFKIHFDLLPKPGPGSAFMSWQFQQELKYGKQDSYERPSFTQKFLELNQTMYTASAGITTEHPYGSRWHIWPLDENGSTIGMKISRKNPLKFIFLAIRSSGGWLAPESWPRSSPLSEKNGGKKFHRSSIFWLWRIWPIFCPSFLSNAFHSFTTICHRPFSPLCF